MSKLNDQDLSLAVDLTDEEKQKLDGTPFTTMEEYDAAMKDAFSSLGRRHKNHPICHLTPMMIEISDEEGSTEEWFECEYCGHTKDINWTPVIVETNEEGT